MGRPRRVRRGGAVLSPRLSSALAVTFATAFAVTIAAMAYRHAAAAPSQVHVYASTTEGAPRDLVYDVPPDPVWTSPWVWTASWVLGLSVGVLAGVMYHHWGRRTSDLSGEKVGET